MARTPVDLPPAGSVLALVDEHGRIAARVTPGARSEAVAIEDGKLTIRVRAPAQDGRATLAAQHALASALGTSPSRLRLLRGAASREKLWQLSD